jgi:septal ring factor EnvC (AmiA/AmiB activator)
MVRIKGKINERLLHRLHTVNHAKFTGIISFSVFCLFLLSLILTPFSTTDASDPNDKLQKIQKRLLQEKSKVEKTRKKEESIVSELENINKSLRKKQKSLKEFDDRLSQTRSKIRKLENEIALLNNKLGARNELLQIRLRSLYKQKHGTIADILVSAKDNQDLMKRMRYISLIAQYDRNLMESYIDEIENLNVIVNRMEALHNELGVNKQNVAKKTKELKAERKNKDELLAAVKNKRSSYEKMIRELEDSSKKLREMIKNLEKEKEKETLPPAGTGFGNLRKRLPWPVYGKVLLPFGKQVDPNFKMTTYRKGIEIEADLGSAVLVVAGGRVVFADWFKGYGLLVIVNHGSGYHTLYANLSEIFHKTGDVLKRRQSVGRVGESGVLNTSTLYFEIRHKGKPLNPLNWLRARKKIK